MDSLVPPPPFDDEASLVPVAKAAAAPFLLVLCHGLGANARQLAPLAAQWREAFSQAIFFRPNAPARRRGRFWLPHGRQWFDIGQNRTLQMAQAARSAAWLNQQVDAELARLCLPAQSVLFCGFSQGAMVCLLAGLRRRVAPRGIVALAGSLMVPPGEFMPRCRPPVLLVHGSADAVVPLTRSEEAAARLTYSGVTVQLEILPGLGHLIVADAAPIAASFIAETCA
jgi:phospholipase/carboxylesterase